MATTKKKAKRAKPAPRTTKGKRTSATKKLRIHLHPASRVISHAAEMAVELPKVLLVAAAVSAQLIQEGKWPPNDANRTMASYHYNINTLDNFLQGVQVRLQAAQPPHAFTFDNAFVAANIPKTVAALTGSIDDHTT